jgi:uncharacterized metal-binding protein
VLEQKNCCCSGGVKLIFACSGGSDVGEIADRAARSLTRDGAGKMYCLAGVGGRVPGILANVNAAGSVLAIDGCSLACASHCLTLAGFTRFAHLKLPELGMEKGVSPPTDDAVAKTASAARERLAAAG